MQFTEESKRKKWNKLRFESGRSSTIDYSRKTYDLDPQVYLAKKFHLQLLHPKFSSFRTILHFLVPPDIPQIFSIFFEKIVVYRLRMQTENFWRRLYFQRSYSIYEIYLNNSLQIVSDGPLRGLSVLFGIILFVFIKISVVFCEYHLKQICRCLTEVFLNPYCGTTRLREKISFEYWMLWYKTISYDIISFLKYSS